MLRQSITRISCPIAHKRASFRHEEELRATVVSQVPNVLELPEEGVDIPIDVWELLESIYVARGEREWFKQTVESVLDKYGYHVPRAGQFDFLSVLQRMAGRFGVIVPENLSAKERTQTTPHRNC